MTLWLPDYKIFSPELILCYKTSAILYKKLDPQPQISDSPPSGVCSSWGRVYHNTLVALVCQRRYPGIQDAKCPLWLKTIQADM